MYLTNTINDASSSTQASLTYNKSYLRKLNLSKNARWSRFVSRADFHTLLRERVTLLPLKHEYAGVQTHRAPLNGLGDLPLPQLDLLAVSAEIWIWAKNFWRENTKINESSFKDSPTKCRELWNKTLCFIA